MAKQPTRRQIAKTMKRLSDGDKERVLEFAERLAKGSGRHTGKESLAENDGAPSYLAAAGDREYEHEKKSREAGSWG